MKKIFKDLFFAFFSQCVSLFLSIIMSLAVPKLLGVEQFSYWQLFLFYCTYVGFFHFGITDGVYLKNGGKKYEDLDKKDIAFQFWMLFGVQLILIVLIVLLNCILNIEYNRKLILLLSGIYMCIANMNWFLGFVFQATDRIKNYSFSVIIDRGLFILCVIIGFILDFETFLPFIIMYIVTRLLSLVYCLYKGKEIVFSKINSLKVGIQNTIEYVRIGVKLTLSSIASLLILGIGRFVIDNIWGLTAFGKVSFSLSLTNFFLLFIQQVSLILFPNLRRVDEKKLKEFYGIARLSLGLILPLVFVVYVPMKFFISLWLPQYEESLRYLALLLPLCTFDGKMQMLCNTFFKVLREEKVLLNVNIISMILSFILCCLGGFVFKNLYFIIIAMVITIAFRSIISEIYLCKKIESNVNVIKYLLQEILIVIVFMISSWFLKDIWAFMIITLTYMIYLILNIKKIKCIKEYMQEKLFKKEKTNIC